MQVERWAKLGSWLPTSSQQVLEYIRHKGYPVPKERKSRKPTSNNEGIANLIEKVAPNDPVLPRVIEARKLRKAIGYLYDTYLGRDGRMHPQFTFLPDTGRLSSRAPNFQNIPQGRHAGVERDLARAIRSTVIPSPGCVLLELDWKAIEALLVGYFARDDEYMRVCRLDPHSYLAGHVLARRGVIHEVPGTGWSDADLKAYLGDIKKRFPDERQLAKKNNHAGNYDQGPKNRAKDIGCSIEEAKFYMEVTDAIAPKVKAWKQETRFRAHLEGWLENPFGYRRAFFNVFEFRDGKAKLGLEAWEALAFLPQSTCAAMCRETVLTVAALPNYGKDFWLLVPIHDSLLLEVRKEKVDEVRILIKGIMEKKWDELEGLWVDVDAKVGHDWASMEEVK